MTQSGEGWYMAKLDVGVGDEFPTEEIHRDENGVVHHHHYYRRRRGPYGFLRVILTIALIMMVFRLFDYSSWMDMDLPWMPHGLFRFAGTLVGIAVIVGLLAFCRRDFRDRPW
jgi:hypothetical protein